MRRSWSEYGTTGAGGHARIATITAAMTTTSATDPMTMRRDGRRASGDACVAPSIDTRYTSTGRTMFLTCRDPMSSNSNASLSSTWSRTSAAHADAAGLGEGLEARRDVHAVAEDVVALVDDVADVDADAQDDPAVVRDADVAQRHAALEVDREPHRVDDARELEQQAVAHRLDDAAVVLGDLRVDQLAAVRLERGQRAALVAPHQSE
jgi:hypothetical protein